MFRLRSKEKPPVDAFTVLLHAIRSQKYKQTKIEYKQPLTAAQINELIEAVSSNPYLRENLTELDLSTPNIQNKVDEDASLRIANFTKLKIIKLSGRNFKHIALHNLPALFWFNANNNLLETIKAFKTPKLQYLLLTANKFKTFLASAFPSVEELDLCDNLLEHLDVTTMPRLQSLDVNANPLRTLLYQGAPLRNGITCHSADYDAVSKKIISLRKLGSPNNVKDESLDIAELTLEALKITNEELEEYLKSLLQLYKGNTAPILLTQAMNFFHKMYISRESSTIQAFKYMPDEILYKVASKRFYDSTASYFKYVTSALYELTDDKQKSRVDSFIEQAGKSLAATGSIMIFKAMHPKHGEVGSTLYRVINAKLAKLTELDPSQSTSTTLATTVSRPSRSITPAYAAFQMMRGFGKAIAKSLPEMSSKSKKKKVVLA